MTCITLSTRTDDANNHAIHTRDITRNPFSIGEKLSREAELREVDAITAGRLRCVKKFLKRQAEWIGKVFGVQREEIQMQQEKKPVEALAVSVSLQENRNNAEGITFLPDSSPHLIDQNLMRSPILQEILQQSPAEFIADVAVPLSTSTSGKVPTFIAAPGHEAMAQRISRGELIGADEQDTEPMVAIVKQGNTVPLPALPQNLRTDPVLNAVRKQALMGIFVILGQEKVDDVAMPGHESEKQG